MQAINALNTFITIWMHHLALYPFTAQLIYIVAFVFDMWVGVAGFLYLLFLSHQKYTFSIDNILERFAEAFRAWFIIVALWIFAWVVKTITAIPRPYVALDAITPLGILPTESYMSFPSGHATLFFALAMAIYTFHKKAGVLFFVLATLISLARVAAGVHYIGDVFVGMIIGILGTYLFEKMFDTFLPTKKR